MLIESAGTQKLHPSESVNSSLNDLEFYFGHLEIDRRQSVVASRDILQDAFSGKAQINAYEQALPISSNAEVEYIPSGLPQATLKSSEVMRLGFDCMRFKFDREGEKDLPSIRQERAERLTDQELLSVGRERVGVSLTRAYDRDGDLDLNGIVAKLGKSYEFMGKAFKGNKDAGKMRRNILFQPIQRLVLDHEVVWYNTGIVSRNLLSIGFQVSIGGLTSMGVLDRSGGVPMERDYVDGSRRMVRGSGEDVAIKKLFGLFGSLQRRVLQDDLQGEWLQFFGRE